MKTSHAQIGSSSMWLSSGRERWAKTIHSPCGQSPTSPEWRMPGDIAAKPSLSSEQAFQLLYGKTYMGHVLLCQKRYQEAETLLVSVVKAHQESRPNHLRCVVILAEMLHGSRQRPRCGKDSRENGGGFRGNRWQRSPRGETTVQRQDRAI